MPFLRYLRHRCHILKLLRLQHRHDPLYWHNVGAGHPEATFLHHHQQLLPAMPLPILTKSCAGSRLDPPPVRSFTWKANFTCSAAAAAAAAAALAIERHTAAAAAAAATTHRCRIPLPIPAELRKTHLFIHRRHQGWRSNGTMLYIDLLSPIVCPAMLYQNLFHQFRHSSVITQLQGKSYAEKIV